MDDESPEFSDTSLSAGGDAQPKSRYFPPTAKSLKSDETEFTRATTADDLKKRTGSSLSVGSSESDDEAVSITLSSHQYTKLEVIEARKISKLLRWFTTVIALAALYTVLIFFLARTVWKIEAAGPDGQLENYIPPDWYFYLRDVITLVLFFFGFVLVVTYTIRVKRLERSNRIHQQVWVIILLASALLYLGPYETIMNLIRVSRPDELGLTVEGSWGYTWFLAMYTTTIRPIVFLLSNMFYVWASVHSYGLVKAKPGPLFYLTKLSAILGLIIIKLVLRIELRVLPSELPFGSMIVLLYRFRGRGIPNNIAIAIGVLTVYEFILICLIVRRIVLTKRELRKADYLRYRTQQIGFRFFLYVAFNFFVVFWVLYVIAVFSIPDGPLRFFSGSIQGEDLAAVRNLLGLQIMVLAYAVLEAYVNLPADATGFRGWLWPQTQTGDTSVTPITYRKLEPSADTRNLPDFQSNCFIMQTHVEMFNFAWLVYYHGTPKYANLKQTPGLFSYKIVCHAHDADTDTHALVVDGSDRIVVAFRGTSSVRNLRTDMKAFHMRCSRVIPTKLEEQYEFEISDPLIEKTLASNEFRSAKLHKGFSLAYMSIAPKVMKFIKDLHDERERPIYLTGHSLGGSLAAICSLDLVLKLGVGPNDVFVSSFGAPRVGNGSFRNLYNVKVPNHWRIVIGPDLVTKLPKVGYRHVGKKVLLTAAGELFIDPTAVELKHWHGDPTSILYHRKASYLLAMRAWCRKYHKQNYEPHFWPFPVTDDDSRRFPDAGKSKPLSNRDPRRMNRKRIMALDAMVDALDRKKQLDVSEYALSNWARLTRRVLLNEQFRRRNL